MILNIQNHWAFDTDYDNFSVNLYKIHDGNSFEIYEEKKCVDLKEILYDGYTRWDFITIYYNITNDIIYLHTDNKSISKIIISDALMSVHVEISDYVFIIKDGKVRYKLTNENLDILIKYDLNDFFQETEYSEYFEWVHNYTLKTYNFIKNIIK